MFTWAPGPNWRALYFQLSPGFCRNSGQVLWECVRAWPHLSHGQGASHKTSVSISDKKKHLQVHWILNELVMGGMVLETNMSEIMLRIEEQNKIEKEEVMRVYLFTYIDLCEWSDMKWTFPFISFLWRIFWSKMICFVKCRQLELGSKL